MAFPGPAPAYEQQHESFAVDTRARSATVRPSQLTITDPREAWHYMANAASLQCLRGHIVPRLALVSFQPGLNGNSKNPGYGEGALQAMVAKGWVQVPHDFPVVAWGDRRVIAAPSTYLQRWNGVHADGHTPTHTYSSAWDRPRAIGSRIVWSHDDDGHLQFLRDVMRDIVKEDSEDPVIIEIAAHNAIASLRSLAGSVAQSAEAERKRIIASLSPAVLAFYKNEFPAFGAELAARDALES